MERKNETFTKQEIEQAANDIFQSKPVKIILYTAGGIALCYALIFGMNLATKMIISYKNMDNALKQ